MLSNAKKMLGMLPIRKVVIGSAVTSVCAVGTLNSITLSVFAKNGQSDTI